MHGRRVFMVGAGALALCAPTRALAAAKRPQLWVTVHANHPLRASLGDDLDAPTAAVAEALREVGDWSSWVPMFTRSDVVERNASRTTFDGDLDLPWPVRDRSFRAHARPRGAQDLELERVPGVGNMGDFSAQLEVRDLAGERSTLRAEVEVDFGLRLTTGFIEWLVRIKAPQLFSALELRAQAIAQASGD